MKTLFYSFTFALLYLFSSSAWAATYWAHPSGSDVNACSAVDGTSDPGLYRTLAGIYTCLSAAGGDTAKLKAGTYNYSATNPAIPNGASAANPTKIHCETISSPPACIWRPTGAASGVPILLFSNQTKSNIEWSGIKFDASAMTNPYSAFRSTGGSITNFWFRNCEASAVGVVTGNTQVAGFYFGTTTNGGGVSHCHIHHWLSGLVGAGAHGAYLKGNNVTIEYSHIHDVDGLGVQVYDSGSTDADNIVKYSRIHHTGRGGILFGSDIDRGIAHHNIVYNTGSIGISISAGSSNSQVYSNTVYKAATTGISIGNTSTLVRNNIAFGSGGTNISNCATAPACSNNLTTEPLFVNNAAGCENTNTCNFSLLPNSDAINEGITTGITGLSFVGSFPDCGALEAPIFSLGTVLNATPATANYLFALASQSTRGGIGLQTATTANYSVVVAGAGATENNAAIVGNAQVDIGLAAAVTNGQSVTGAYTRGTLTDNVCIGGDVGGCTNAEVRTFSAQTFTNSVAVGGSPVFTSVNYRVFHIEGTIASPKWRGPLNATTGAVMPGGYTAFALGITCTGANCDPTGFDIYQSRNGAAYAALTDTCTSLVPCFGIAGGSTLVDGEAIPSALTTNPTGTFIAGKVIGQASTNPQVDLTQDSMTQMLPLVKTDPTTAVGDTLCFQARATNSAHIEPTQFPCFTVVNPSLSE